METPCSEEYGRKMMRIMAIGAVAIGILAGVWGTWNGWHHKPVWYIFMTGFALFGMHLVGVFVRAGICLLWSAVCRRGSRERGEEITLETDPAE